MKTKKYECLIDLRFLCFIGIFTLGFIIGLGPALCDVTEGAETEKLGDLRYITLQSKQVGLSYRIGVATPPGYNASGTPYPAVFALDGSYYLQTFREWFFQDDSDIIIVAVLNSNRRNIDYMPPNNCTMGGGGHSAFLQFLTLELLPYLDENYNIDPLLRLLFGHSHGGSFVFYTLFSDHGENFPFLLSTDASIGCNLPYFQDLARRYSLVNDSLRVVIYAAGASQGNAEVVRSFMHNYVTNDYEGLVAKYEEFQGSHDGILSNALPNGFTWIGSQIELPPAPTTVLPFILLLLDNEAGSVIKLDAID